MAEIEGDTQSGGAEGGVVRRFGRFELRELIGRSQKTMAWRAFDPMVEAELLLVLPRSVPRGAKALAAWESAARLAARLDHPHLLPISEVGSHEGWPYLSQPIADMQPLSAILAQSSTALSTRQGAGVLAECSRALAFAHEAGVVHGDLQPYLFLLSESGHLRLAGLESAGPRGDGAKSGVAPESEIDLVRSAARDDLVALGLLMQWLLAGKPPLEEPDLGAAIQRIAPRGKEFARLPPVLAVQVPEPLRAIANRATDRHERRRYQNARTLQSALEGWLQSDSEAGAGAMELVLQKVSSMGLLPAMPGVQQRVSHLALLEQQQVSALAEVVLEDIGLTFEMLRAVNQAQSQEPRLVGAPPILTIRRALAMLGLDGVRRASRALREWPGPLEAEACEALDALMERCREAGRIAQALRPVGYDPEIVFVVTLLQNLGRLVAHFHFPDECAQIHRLVHPPPPEEGQEQEPGMSEQAASYAVLGLDLDTIGTEVARYCGLNEATLSAFRRLPSSQPVHPPQGDDEALRLTASCANEAVDALQLRPPQAAAALASIVMRYAKALKLTTEILRDALTMNGMSDEVEIAWLGRRRGRAALR